jgi:hypothetical protein
MDAFMAPLLPGGADNVLGEPLDEHALDELASFDGLPLADDSPMPTPGPASPAPAAAAAAAAASSAPTTAAAAAAASPAGNWGTLPCGGIVLDGITVNTADVGAMLGAVEDQQAAAAVDRDGMTAAQVHKVARKHDVTTFFGKLSLPTDKGGLGVCRPVRTPADLVHSIRVLSRASTDREGASSALMVDRHQTINLGAPGDGGRFLCTLCRCVVRKKWQTHLAQHCRTLERELKKKTGLDGGGPGDTIAIPADLQATCRDLLEQTGGGGGGDDDDAGSWRRCFFWLRC